MQSADGRSRPASPCPPLPRPDQDQARPPPPAQRPTRRASSASTRYASCHEPHDPRQPDAAPAASRSLPSLLRQTLSSSTPSSRNTTCTPQDKMTAPAVTPPSTPVRERGRGVAYPPNDVFFGYAPVQQARGFSGATYPPLGIMRKEG